MDKISINLPDFRRKDNSGWIYFLYHGDEIVYVGQTLQAHPMGRIGAHFENKVFDSFSAMEVGRHEINKKEIEYINLYTPKYNKAGLAKPKENGDFINHSTARELWIKMVSEKGLEVTENHLYNFGRYLHNVVKLQRVNHVNLYPRNEIIKNALRIYRIMK